MKISRRGVLGRIGLVATSVAAITLSGCLINEGDSNNSVSNNYFSRTGTMQGTVFDATTGMRIGDTSLKITLVQGTSYRSPNVLKKGTDTNAGDFAFAGIPVTVDDSVEYRIVATVDGYQRFEGYVDSYWADFSGNNADTWDTQYNWIGNIYMFPMGATAPDFTAHVTFNSEPVEGAIVHFTQNANGNDTVDTAANTPHRIRAADGVLPHLTATTDASGNAVFSGADLVLGGEYDLVVLPVVHQGTQLAQEWWGNFWIGQDDVVEPVALSEIHPGGGDNGLYIVSISNSDANNIQSNGVLTIVFSRAVSLANEPLITAGLAGTVRSAALDTTPATDQVVGAMSADGLTLTLTPGWTTTPVAFNGSNGLSAGTPTADINLAITYAGVSIIIADGNDGDTLIPVTNLTTMEGVGPSMTVQMTGPEDY